MRKSTDEQPEQFGWLLTAVLWLVLLPFSFLYLILFRGISKVTEWVFSRFPGRDTE